MNRKDTENAITVMTAWLDGAEIETRLDNADERWRPCHPNLGPFWTWHTYEYRVKPKPREFWLNPECGVINEAHEVPLSDVRESWIKVREVIDG